MRTYLTRRLLYLVPVVFGVSVIVFAMMIALPGDPAEAILGSYATPENLETLRTDLDLNRSVPVRYVAWITNVLQGDFGQSYSLGRPVLGEVLARFGATLLLAGTALVFCLLIGVVAGVLASVKHNQWQDRTLTVAALLGLSMPSFWLAMVFVLVFGLRLGWFPTSGMVDAYGGGGVLDVLHHLLLPAFTLGLVASGIIARFTRSSMLENLRQDYVVAAEARGLKRREVIGQHAFRNARVDIVPVVGVQIGFLLGGAVYIETVFNWPGIGRMLVDAIQTRDILLVQGGVLLVALTYVLLNLTADVIQAKLDPRIRIE